MLDVQLFLGIIIDPQLAETLKAVQPGLLSQFVNRNDETSLQHISYKDKEYLGKFVGTMTDFSKLELLELNIRSLIKKILPEHAASRYTFELIPVQEAKVHSKKV